jgi:hypothetical protein
MAWNKSLENNGFKLLHSDSKLQVYMNLSTSEVFVDSIVKINNESSGSNGCARIHRGANGLDIFAHTGKFEVRVINGFAAVGIHERYIIPMSV